MIHRLLRGYPLPLSMTLAARTSLPASRGVRDDRTGRSDAASQSRRERSTWWLAFAMALAAGVILPSSIIAQDSKDQKKAEVKADSKPATKGDSKEAVKSDAPPRPGNQDPKTGEARPAEKPKRVVKRNEYIERPGAPRTALKAFRVNTPLPLPKVEKTDLDRFNQMRRGSIPVDVQLIDRVAKHNVYSLTTRGEEADLSRRVGDILNSIETARFGGRSEVVEPFVRAYTRSLIKYAKDVLNNSIVAQVNTVLLINRLFDTRGDVAEAAPLLVSILRDPKKEDALYYLAMVGLEEAKRTRKLEVEWERNAVDAILDLAARGGVQDVLMDQIVKTLGNLERPYRGDLPERAEVATFLAKIALDPNQPLRRRYEAAVGLGQLKIDAVRNWNAPLAGYVIAKALKEVIDAHKDGKINEDVRRWWTYHLARVMNTGSPRASDGSTRELQQTVTAIFEKVVIEKQEPEIEPLTAWLTSKQPKERRFAPQAAEIDLAPPNAPQAHQDAKTVK